MIDNFFYRMLNFYWEMYDHIYKDNIGYAKYRFSLFYISDYYGKKVVLSGMSFKFEYDKIIEYSECEWWNSYGAIRCKT